MREERFQEAGSRLPPEGRRDLSHAQPRFDEGTRQKRPDRSLMVGAVSLHNAPRVAAGVGGVVGGEGAQADRSQELSLDGVDDPARALSFQERERKPADREDLIGAERLVGRAGNVITVDHVEEAALLLVPETGVEGVLSLLSEIVPAKGKGGGEAQGVDPERLDLHRLSDARRDDPVADLRVHPGELDPGDASRQQAIGVRADPIAGPSRIAFEDCVDGARQRAAVRDRHPPSDAIAGRQILESGDDEPQRRVDRVVFRSLPLVREPVGQHPFRDFA